MKKGDMVKLCEVSYPQYKGELCMIMTEMEVDQWMVLTKNGFHPWKIHTSDITLVGSAKTIKTPEIKKIK